ncbi:MAG TPA: class I SAM-dependent methyltransferase [Syntrophales bacterium]|nr:class I SAM-dependent methyltransferase [Syntrophales bacterium]
MSLKKWLKLPGAKKQGKRENGGGMESLWDLSRYDERFRDYAHWCGAGRWSESRWEQYGADNLKRAFACLSAACGAECIEGLRGKTALEWGCGGGANIPPLCGHFSLVYGIDISPATLEECERRIAGRGIGHFRKVHIESDRPNTALSGISAASVDFSVSFAVFQHFPSPEYSLEVLRTMRDLLRDGGFGLVQVRYDDGSEKFRPKRGDYTRNFITMTSFRNGEFESMIRKAGLEPLFNERDPDDPDCHEYHVFKKG